MDAFGGLQSRRRSNRCGRILSALIGSAASAASVGTASSQGRMESGSDEDADGPLTTDKVFFALTNQVCVY